MPSKNQTSRKKSAVDLHAINLILVLASSAVWSWAFALLATRHVHILNYEVIASAPPAWGFIALPIGDLAGVLIFGMLMFALGRRVDAGENRVASSSSIWLLLSAPICLLDLLRLADLKIPYTFAEPLYFAFVTGCAVSVAMGRKAAITEILRRASDRRCLIIVWCLTILAATWWFMNGKAAYDNFFLGFHDLGHFARRVVNTWEGRGFLMETPSLPPFWDHFNPGLALLAPLWGLWPSPLLFVLLQSLCLALPAPLVYGIARRHGHSPATSAIWSATYLCFPAVGQMNLNYGYGWHPVSMAMPLLFAAMFLLLGKRRIAALFVGLLACMFNEVVFVVIACLGAAMAWQSSRSQKSAADSERDDGPSETLARSLSVLTWLVVWATFTAGFVLVYHFAGFAEFQRGRVELNLLNAFQIESAWFILALLIPLGLASPLRGWPVLLAVAIPVSVVLMWTYEHTTSISFQYSSTLTPFLLVAAIAGAAQLGAGAHSNKSRKVDSSARQLSIAGGALAAGLVASLLFGALPRSRPALEVLNRKVYHRENIGNEKNDQQLISDRIKELTTVVEMVNRHDASVLATGNLALHFLDVKRIEPLNEAAQGSRNKAFDAEAGPDRSWIEIFDWVVLDTNEYFQQGPELIQKTLDEAKRQGFNIVRAKYGVVVLRR